MLRTLNENVTLDKLGGMADFTRWGYAVEEACGIGGEVFLKAYLNNQKKANQEAVESGMVISRTTNKLADGTKKSISYYACGNWKNKGTAVCNSNSIRTEKLTSTYLISFQSYFLMIRWLKP